MKATLLVSMAAALAGGCGNKQEESVAPAPVAPAPVAPAPVAPKSSTQWIPKIGDMVLSADANGREEVATVVSVTPPNVEISLMFRSWKGTVGLKYIRKMEAEDIEKLARGGFKSPAEEAEYKRQLDIATTKVISGRYVREDDLVTWRLNFDKSVNTWHRFNKAGRWIQNDTRGWKWMLHKKEILIFTNGNPNYTVVLKMLRNGNLMRIGEVPRGKKREDLRPSRTQTQYIRLQ